MLRSLILIRSQHLVSHLRRPCNGAASRRLILPARPYASHTDTNPQPEARPRRHLYLVLNEIHATFSVYKLNVDDLDGGDEDAVDIGINGAAAAHHQNHHHQPCRRRRSELPEPILRLGYSAVGSYPQFEALGGGKIAVTGEVHTATATRRITLVYDTKTAKLDVGQPLPDGLFWQYHAAAVGDDKLYTLDGSPSRWHCLCAEEGPDCGFGGGYDNDADSMLLCDSGPGTEWVWKKRSPPQPAAAGDEAEGDSTYGPVESYAVHPNGRTIFVSCLFAYSCLGSKPPFTFTMDTEESTTSRRQRRGDWSLPFRGRGHYDGDLDAWVGIRELYEEEDRSPYLFSCDVPPDDALLAGDSTELEAPAWKMCKEKLTFLEEDTAAWCSAFVHTGRGRFCLVEAVPSRPGARVRDLLLHVTMFRAKHGKNGELLVTPCRPGRSYAAPNVAAGPPVAFWM